MKKKPPGNPSSLRVIKKGERPWGRAKGTPNKITRDIKEALVRAAELSDHSETHDLVGYMVYLANRKQETFASLLGRLIPLQAKISHDQSVNVKLDITMSLQDMVNNFEQRIKAAYVPQATAPQLAPPIIEQDPVDA